MEYYLALKSKEILIHVTTWMNHEDFMLSKINRHKRTNIVYFDLYEVGTYSSQIHRDGKQNGGCQGLGID